MGKQPSDALDSMKASARYLEWVGEARRLRSEAVANESDFLAHLMAGEPDEALWRGAGHATFAGLLSAENLCKEARYHAFKAAVTRFGLAHVRANGFESMRLALIIPVGAPSRNEECDEDAATAVVHDFAAFRERNHTPPSVQQATAIVAKHYERPAKPRQPPTSAEARVIELEAENADLCRKLAAALRKIAAYETAADRSRERFGGAKTPVGARAAKKGNGSAGVADA